MLEDLTICVITFLRPRCIDRFLRSLRIWYPDVRCLVADDGDDAIVPEICKLARAEHVKLSFDSGIPAKRNALLDMVDTRLMLVADDDHVFGDETRLGRLAGAIDDGGFDAVGAHVMNVNGDETWGHGLFSRVGDRAVCLPKYVKVEPDRAGCAIADFVENFFVARTDAMRRIRWPEEQKLYDHIVFWWLAWETGLRVGYCDDVIVRHVIDLTSERYVAMKSRSRDWRPNMLRLMRAREFVRVKSDEGLKKLVGGEIVERWVEKHRKVLPPLAATVESVDRSKERPEGGDG